MRPTPLRFALAAVALAVVAGLAPAQFGFTPKARIEKVRVGFRPTSGGERDTGARVSDVCKVGLWAPVSVGVEFLNVKGYKKGIHLEVTTTDCDDLRTVSRFPLIPALADTLDVESDEFLRERGEKMRKDPNEMTNTAYVRLPSDTAEITLRLVQEDDPERSLSDTVKLDGRDFRPRATSKYVILTLGGKLPGLEFARRELYGSRVEQAHLDDVRELPDQWFGYEAADLVVLPTGGPKQEFVSDLFTSGDPNFARKRRALFEWVRRGGRLVVTAGERADAVAASAEFTGYEDKATKEWVPGVLPVQVQATPKVASLRWAKAGTLNPSTVTYPERQYTLDDRKAFPALFSGGMRPDDIPSKRPPGLFSVAALKPNPKKTPFATLLSSDTRTEPLVVQAPLGLGRVTVVGFDADRPPFTDESSRAARTEFWEWLVEEAGDRVAAKLPDPQLQKKPADDFNPNPRGRNQPQPTSTTRDGEDGVVAALRGSVDYYDEVPVISFGWVALFILGYTLLIGPIEYILLKKLLGKLEYTWVTFPIIVLTVSGAAYLTAYAVKGKDLRMNKIDVVDIDLRSDPSRPRVYGRTWFTIFSPRIDSYTVGVEPKENWASTTDDRGYTPVTTVDWFGLPSKQSTGGGSRGYTYQIDPRGDGSPQANGVSGVPIQVWSTKAFTANWSGVTAPAAPPVTADIRKNASGEWLTGEIRYNLALKDVDQAFAVYKGMVYPFQKAVLPGVPVSTSEIQREKGQTAESLFQNDPKFTPRERDDDNDFGWGGRGGRNQQQKAATTAANKDPLHLWGLLFHQQTTRLSGLQNGTLRPLDQSWRLSEANDGEVILLFKLKRASKQDANKLMTEPDSASPTRVWLHGLPGRANDKWAIDGIAQQDTYVRMYLPVKPAGR